MTFFNDLFNETSNTALASHVPDTGGTWVKHPNYSGTVTVNAASDWAIGDSTTSALYYNDVTPPSADYSVSATLQINTTTTPNTGVMGRVSSSASTMYMFYTSGSSWVLAKLVGGTNTDLINVTFTPTLNTDYTIELSMVGTTISAKVNGSHIAGSPVTDSSITAGGFPGARWRSGGSLKDITAVNLGAGNATITGTTSLPSFSGSAQVAPETSITVTTALPAFSGGASTGAASATVTATTSLPSFSGSATGDTSSGVLTLPVLKNNTGTVLANETGATVHVYAVSTGNKVVTKTGQTTNASGVMTVTDALIVGGTQYRVVVVLGSGAEGLDKVTAT